MTSSRSFKRGANSLKRGKPRIPSSGKAFLLVTEGEKTEPNYFLALRDRLHISTADITIVHPSGTDPRTLVEEAFRLRNRRMEEAKSGWAIAYDEVWVVFDLESVNHPRRKQYKGAMELGRSKGINFAFSDPCFEYWLLLHEKYTTAPFENTKKVLKELKGYWLGYKKTASPSLEFLEKIPAAVERSEKCRKHHQDVGGDGNPSTEVDCLIRVLNQAARPDWQFQLEPPRNADR